MLVLRGEFGLAKKPRSTFDNSPGFAGVVTRFQWLPVGQSLVCGLTAIIMLAAEAVKRYTKREEKETEKICETFAGRLEDIVARDAAEREEKEWQKTA